MKNRSAELFLHDILDSVTRILKYSNGLNYDDLIKNEMAVDAIVRNFEIIGEAAKFIPEEFKNKYQELPLKEMVGMRNILIHDYLGINYKFIWQTIQEDLPELKKTITKIKSVREIYKATKAPRVSILELIL